MSEPYTLVTPDPSDNLSLKAALTSFALIVIIVGFAITGALYFNQQRRKVIIDRYTKETTDLVGNKQAASLELFTNTFDDCKKTLEKQQSLESVVQKSSDISCPAAITQLAKLDVNQLKDSSAVAYVRITNGDYELIEASGKYNQLRSLHDGQPFSHFSFDDTVRNDLANYLLKQQPILMWQDFIMYTGGKEVIVPVVVDNKTVGYIFRGVIER